jgi:hypothetical protein
MSKQYVVFSDLTYAELDSTELWVAVEGNNGTNEDTLCDVIDGIDEGSNEPYEPVCARYDIASIIEDLQSQGKLEKYRIANR